MSRTIVEAECVNCGASVKRLLAVVQRNEDWREHVLCPTCRERSDPTAAHIAEMVATQSRERWERLVRRFDAAAGYERASLDEGRDSQWGKAARSALNTWLDPSEVTRSGVMLVGPTGIGKTRAAFAIANAAAQAGYADSIRVSSEVELLGAQVAPWELGNTLERWVNGARVLIVDDIGVAARQQDQIQAGWKQLCDLVSAQPRSILLVGTSNRASWAKSGGIVDWIGQQSGSRLRSWMTLSTTGFIDHRTDTEHPNWAAHLRG